MVLRPLPQSLRSNSRVREAYKRGTVEGSCVWGPLLGKGVKERRVVEVARRSDLVFGPVTHGLLVSLLVPLDTAPRHAD